jgi:hypothetical protein
LPLTHWKQQYILIWGKPMSKRMTDERLAEIDAIYQSELGETSWGDLGNMVLELLQAMKAERERIAELADDLQLAKTFANPVSIDIFKRQREQIAAVEARLDAAYKEVEAQCRKVAELEARIKLVEVQR